MCKLPDSIYKEAARLLKADPADHTLYEELAKQYVLLQSVAEPKSTYKLVLVKQTDEGVLLDDFEIKSNDLKKLFANSKSAFLLAVTLGTQTDALLRRKSAENMAQATLLDACASAEVERLCDILEQNLAAKIEPGKYFTQRFAPGYGDVRLKYMSKLVNVLNTQKVIGLSVSMSDMLVPTKSVVALLGISNIKEKRGTRCETCAANADCYWKKRGELCGVQL